MTYWKIEKMEELLELEKDMDDDFTITKNYLKYLGDKLNLMKECYEAGLIAGRLG